MKRQSRWHHPWTFPSADFFQKPIRAPFSEEIPAVNLERRRCQTQAEVSEREESRLAFGKQERKAPNKEIQQKIMETVSVNRQTSEERGQQHLRRAQSAIIKLQRWRN